MVSDKSEAIKVLAGLVTNPAKTEFASSLLAALVKGNVSDKQAAWIDRLVDEAKNPVEIPDLTPIIEAFKTTSVKFPKIKGVIDGTEVVISWTAPDSAHPKVKDENRGTCAINTGKYGDPNAKFYGRIKTDGSLAAGRDLNAAVVSWLKEVAENPQPQGK